MVDNAGAKKRSSRLREVVRNRRTLHWTGGAIVLIALIELTWLERKRVHFAALRECITHPPEWFFPLGLGAGALFALATLWIVPKWQVKNVKDLDSKERFDSENEARKTLATILGGIVLLAGFFGTWQNIKVAQEAASISQRGLVVSQEGQITDRFGKAIEQLGAVDSTGKAKVEVRLGGIYALEGIAKESKELHWPIMEVMCTYVRVNAPIKRKDLAGTLERAKHPASGDQALDPRNRPSADIQAILTVIGRRDRRYEREDQHLDLTKTDLSGADLTKADLTEADLTGAYLYQADLFEAKLQGASLQLANLSGALLKDAHLRGTYLRYAELSKADLGDADLTDADLTDADLNGAWAYRANFSGTSLGGADLTYSDLNDAHLSGAYLGQSKMSGAHLDGAVLNGAQLSGADLRDALYVTQQQIDGAFGDSATRLPENLHKPEKWKK